MDSECYGCAHSCNGYPSEDICKVCLRNPDPFIDYKIDSFVNGSFVVSASEDLYISSDRLRLERQGFSLKSFMLSQNPEPIKPSLN